MLLLYISLFIAVLVCLYVGVHLWIYNNCSYIYIYTGISMYSLIPIPIDMDFYLYIDV